MEGGRKARWLEDVCWWQHGHARGTVFWERRRAEVRGFCNYWAWVGWGFPTSGEGGPMGGTNRARR